jgi:hypothetical protein
VRGESCAPAQAGCLLPVNLSRSGIEQSRCTLPGASVRREAQSDGWLRCDGPGRLRKIPARARGRCGAARGQAVGFVSKYSPISCSTRWVSFRNFGSASHCSNFLHETGGPRSARWAILSTNTTLEAGDQRSADGVELRRYIASARTIQVCPLSEGAHRRDFVSRNRWPQNMPTVPCRPQSAVS